MQFRTPESNWTVFWFVITCTLIFIGVTHKQLLNALLLCVFFGCHFLQPAHDHWCICNPVTGSDGVNPETDMGTSVPRCSLSKPILFTWDECGLSPVTLDQLFMCSVLWAPPRTRTGLGAYLVVSPCVSWFIRHCLLVSRDTIARPGLHRKSVIYSPWDDRAHKSMAETWLWALPWRPYRLPGSHSGWDMWQGYGV